LEKGIQQWKERQESDMSFSYYL